MPKRGNGEGSVYKRKADGKWVGSVTLENGKRKVFYGKTKKEVTEKLVKARGELQQGTLIVNEPTIKEYLNTWLKTHKQSVRSRTYERYESIVRLHLVPTLGKIKLSKLTPQHLELLYTKKLDSGLSPRTVNAIHSMLNTALDKAMRQGLIHKNVCKMVSPRRAERKEFKTLTIDQIRKLLAAAEDHPLRALFYLAATTGMRRGELFGLKWQDIDFQQGCLYVRRALVRMPTGQGYKESEPKTSKSRRRIVLIPIAKEALKLHRVNQLVIREQAGKAWQDNDYVFCSALGTNLQPGHSGLVQLKGLLKKAGLPDIRFHDLRHSTATFLFALGVHPKVVQELLGHSEIGITMDIYSHSLPTMQEDAMQKMADAFLEKLKEDDTQKGDKEEK